MPDGSPPADPELGNSRGRAYVYVLRCCDDSLYTGWTTDVGRRLRAHAAGCGARYTRSRLPVTLAACWEVANRSEALRLEARFKRLSREEKMALCDAATAHRAIREGTVAVCGATHGVAERESIVPTTYQPPTLDEVSTLAADAEHLQARITTPHGDIVFAFYPKDAPMHVAAFIKLARAGFYDGLNFHRVEPGFVIQGGDPEGTGMGGPGYRLKAEFNKRPHLQGTVAMARASNPDSAGSQFYICLEDARFLDGQYTVFGQVTEGLGVVQNVRVGDKMEKVAIEPIPRRG